MPILDEKRGEAIAKKKHPSEKPIQSQFKTIIYLDQMF
jgi:hypothetical protein